MTDESTKNYAIHKEPIPVPGTTPIAVLVIRDIGERMAYGIKTYGRPLEAHNGRDALADAYQEALDLAIYLRQCIFERDNPKSKES